tara:strand:- start:5009 stop:5158 length:150 start_codon:yes stop_codon:yes gene_type:complete
MHVSEGKRWGLRRLLTLFKFPNAFHWPFWYEIAIDAFQEKSGFTSLIEI